MTTFMEDALRQIAYWRARAEQAEKHADTLRKAVAADLCRLEPDICGRTRVVITLSGELKSDEMLRTAIAEQVVDLLRK